MDSSSDIEMVDPPRADPPAPSAPQPTTSSTSAQPPPLATTASSSTATSSKPLSTKPKSSKSSKPNARPRSPSPSPPPPPPPPPPLQTIRLTIPLGGPSNYEVDIALKAKETGQRPPTPVNVGDKRVRVLDTSDDSEPEEAGKKPKRKRKSAAQEYYDVQDPFIDDSELAIDERTFFAQTKQKGFYVSSGEVALLRDKSPKKPKSVAVVSASGVTPKPKPKPKALGFLTHPTAKSGLSSLLNEGTKDTPIALSSDVDDRKPVLSHHGQNGSTSRSRSHSSGSDAEQRVNDVMSSLRIKREPDDGEYGEEPQKTTRRYRTEINESGKRKKVVILESFHPEIQRRMKELQQGIMNATWEKGKFPNELREPLGDLACVAIKLDEYDDHFFNLMPQFFPYNKFTMTKLIKRTVFAQHVELLQTAQDNLLRKLEKETKDGLSKAEEEWEKTVLAWDKRQEKILAGAANANANANSTTSATASVDGGAGANSDDPASDAENASANNADATPKQNPPTKKYRMTESIKAIIWQLVKLSNECCRLENEKNKLEGLNHQVSEQGSRKVLYQKIVAAFPSGWMNSSQISREVSSMKKKAEKEMMENEDS